jgi:hypothetical protein
MIVCTAVIAVVIYVSSYVKENKVVSNALDAVSAEYAEYKAIGVAQNLNISEEKDTDNDGLKDWEEVMWATDAENPDTDGDGTYDGEEIAQKRNPKNPSINDEFSKEERMIIGENGIQAKVKANTATDNFSKKFFEEYITSRAGADLSLEDKDSFVSDAVNALQKS